MRRTRIIGFTAISVKLFLSSVILSVIRLKHFMFRCKKKSIRSVNRPTNKKLLRELKEGKKRKQLHNTPW